MDINLNGNTVTEGYFEGIINSLNLFGEDGKKICYINGEGNLNGNETLGSLVI